MVERICFVCRTKHDRSQLVRVFRVKNTDGTYRFGIGANEGRGCHIHKECIEKAIKSRALNRSFKGNVPQEIYAELAEIKDCHPEGLRSPEGSKE